MTRLLRPSVIHLSEWFKREERDLLAWSRIRSEVLSRDNWMCVYCGFHARKFMMVNHIGAEDNHTLENLETVCKPCHSVLHMGMNSSLGFVSVIDSAADQAEIVRQTRALVHARVPWPAIEEEILKRFLAPGGRVYTRDESVAWANTILDIPEDVFRGYLPDGLALVFHEEGPWKDFPEAVHKWGG